MEEVLGFFDAYERVRVGSVNKYQVGEQFEGAIGCIPSQNRFVEWSVQEFQQQASVLHRFSLHLGNEGYSLTKDSYDLVEQLPVVLVQVLHNVGEVVS